MKKHDCASRREPSNNTSQLTRAGCRNPSVTEPTAEHFSLTSPSIGQHAPRFESSFSAPNDGVRTTAREAEREESRLLNVHEVAAMLQVPVSWVYGRMRKRSVERLPGYRLGKYWRFRQAEVLAWVESQKRDSHAA
jgi:excisionase family DNA binding protein